MIKKDKERGHHKKTSKSRRAYVACESASDSSFFVFLNHGTFRSIVTNFTTIITIASKFTFPILTIF